MINLPTQIGNKPYRHVFDGSDPKKETYVDLMFVDATSYDFKLCEYLIAETGYFSQDDMLESCRILDKEAKGRRLTEFTRGMAKAQRRAFVDECVISLVIDGEDLTSEKAELTEDSNAPTIAQWMHIASQHAFYYRSLQQEAEQQIKKS